MAKLNDIRALAESHAEEISRSTKTWTGYLDTAATLYRYDFQETLLIHAQRPDATACAELEIWNSRMGRWVNRGSKGIALIDDSGPRKRLRYVFDISDTHMVRGGKTPYIWQMEPEIRQEMAGYLMDTYGLEYDPDAPLSSVLMAMARAQVKDNLEDAMDGLAYEVHGTYLEGLGEDAIRENFRRLMENSTYYMLAKRCGLDPWTEVTPDDFSGIANFNRLSVLSFLGNAAHDIVEPILKDIGREAIFRYRVIASIRKIDEMIEKAGANPENEVENENGEAYNEFNTLIRESVSDDQIHDREEGREKGENTEEGGREDGSDVHEEGGLPVSEPDDQRGAGAVREVRDAQEDVPEGKQEELVSEHDADREAGEAPAGDRRDGGRADGADLSADGTERRRGREAEGSGPDGLGTADEQHPEPRGGDRTEGIGVQLIPEDNTDDNVDTGITDEAEDNGSSAFSIPAITYFPDLPTAAQQRRQIEERMDALYAGEISIPVEVVDEFLRTGGNRRGSQLRIIYHYMTDPSPEEAAEYVRREYGKGGKGLVINGKDYSVWFDEAGMKFAEGHSVDDPVMAKAYLSWDDVSGRIRQLLAQGEYAPQSVLDAARENALAEHATALAYMERDLADGIGEIVFDDTSIFRGGFPDAVTKISEKLDDPAYLADLIERLEGLSMAYAETPEVMRFNFYNPDRMLAQFRQFAKNAIPFEARDGFAWKDHGIFITQEEADAFLASGGPYSDGRLSTYSHFLRHEDTQERAEFLKNQYGTGGRSHALAGADDSNADYSAKGIVLMRGNGDRPAVLRMSYTQAANRVDYLISHDRFLTAQDYVRMPSYEREQLAAGVIRFFSTLPPVSDWPFKGSIFEMETRREIAAMIEDPDRLHSILSQMDARLAELPETDPRYQMRLDALTDLHAYAEGTFTLFPQPGQEIVVPSATQMSLADLFEMNVSEEAQETAVAEAAEKAREERKPEAAQAVEKGGVDESIKPETVSVTGNAITIDRGVSEPAQPEQGSGNRSEGQTAERRDVSGNAEPAVSSGAVRWASPVMTQETLHPLSESATSEYNAIKQQYPDALVGFEQDGFFEFYGEDARRTAGTMETDLFKKSVPGGEVDVTGFEASRWQSEVLVLWGEGNSIYLAGENADGSHHEAVYLRKEDFLPLNAEVRIDGRDYRIDSVDFERGTVSLQDMTMAREARYPIFRTESVYYVRSYYEEQHAEPSRAEAVQEVKEPVQPAEDSSQDPQKAETESREASEGSVTAPVNAKDEKAETGIVETLPTEAAETQPEEKLEGMAAPAVPQKPPAVQDPPAAQGIASTELSREHREEMIEQDVFDALEKSGTDYGDYSPDQMDVIYEAAEKGFDPFSLCNPAYSPEQMQLIMDINARMKAHAQAQFQGVLDQLTGGALSIDAINAIRAANLLPLEEVPASRGDNRREGTQNRLDPVVIDFTPQGDVDRTGYTFERTEGGERTSTGPETGGSAETAPQELYNFRITDDDLGAGGLKTKFRANMDAIYMLKTLEAENRLATPEEQEVLSRYVGWGGIPQAFDGDRREWHGEHEELRAALDPEEYREARASTLNAFYTSPTVIKAMYQALGSMGLSSGNMLEPSCGIGNFMGLIPESMADVRMYGVELDSVSGRIAKQLYQKNMIAVQGFETTSFPDSFFDAVIGNVPFGQYKVADPRYDRQGFLIHDYFIAKSLDLVRPGGVVAVVTSSGTMDKQNESTRRYLSQRADLLGAIRLPDNAFLRNANTGVVADILFFQKRDRMSLEEPDWVHLTTTPEGFAVNSYFVNHPEMVLGEFSEESTQYGRQS